ncbi:MAG: hypothetical protein EOO54_22755, partial [Haliea sp.]
MQIPPRQTQAQSGLPPEPLHDTPSKPGKLGRWEVQRASPTSFEQGANADAPLDLKGKSKLVSSSSSEDSSEPEGAAATVR